MNTSVHCWRRMSFDGVEFFSEARYAQLCHICVSADYLQHSISRDFLFGMISRMYLTIEGEGIDYLSCGKWQMLVLHSKLDIVAAEKKGVVEIRHCN